VHCRRTSDAQIVPKTITSALTLWFWYQDWCLTCKEILFQQHFVVLFRAADFND